MPVAIRRAASEKGRTHRQIKTTTNDGRVRQLEVVKRKYLATILSTSTGLGGLQKKQTKKNYIVDCSVASTLATNRTKKAREKK